MALLLLVVPLTWSIRDDAALTRTDTRIAAARWIDAHVPKGAVIAAESSTAVPPGYRVVPIRLPLPGHDSRPDLDGARWAITSGAVVDRVLAAQESYPLRAAFYAQLPRPAYRAQGKGKLNGPWVAVYRLYPG